MRRLLTIAALLAAFSTHVSAQIIGNGTWKTVPTVASYTGPGNIVTSAKFFIGLRAYNAAYATGSNNAVNYRRASDNATQNGVILTSGAFDIATANSFAGTDATATCTIATTTATCTGASGTPHVGSTITGAGVSEPCYATAIGTFTSGAGTVTLGGTGTSPCGTISVATTLTFQYGLFVTEAYDQTGNSNNVSQATAGNQPQLLPICGNSLPCLHFGGAGQPLSYSSFSTIAQPYTITYVAQAADTTTQQNIVTATSGGNVIEAGFGKATTATYIYATSFVTTTSPVSVNVLHAAQSVFNGSSSIICVDGTCATGLNPGTFGAANPLIIGSTATGSGDQPLLGYFTESGIWPVAFNSTQYGNMCHNQYTYWTTGASC